MDGWMDGSSNSLSFFFWEKTIVGQEQVTFQSLGQKLQGLKLLKKKTKLTSMQTQKEGLIGMAPKVISRRRTRRKKRQSQTDSKALSVSKRPFPSPRCTFSPQLLPANSLYYLPPLQVSSHSSIKNRVAFLRATAQKKEEEEKGAWRCFKRSHSLNCV